MKIAIVGINYAPEPTGISVYTTGTAEHLVSNGNEVSVYTGFPYYPAWRKREEDRRRIHSKEVVNGVIVCRHWMYVPSQPRALKRILHELSFVTSASVGYLLGPRADVTIVISPPLLLGIPIALLARLRGSLTLFHVQDLQPDAALDLGLLRRGPFTRALFIVERWCYRLCNYVSTITPAMMQRIVDKGVAAEKVFVFPNWADDRMITPRDSDTDYRRSWNLGEKFVVLYSGNLGVKQGLVTLIEAAEILRARKEIEFVIVGDGGEKATLLEKASFLGLENIQFRPLQPTDRLAELLATADVSVIPQKAGVSDIVMPSKLGNILCSARPVVAAASGGTELYRVLKEAGCGRLIEPGDAQLLAAAIESLFCNPHERKLCGERGRRYAEEVLGREAVLDRFSRGLSERVVVREQASGHKQNAMVRRREG